MTIVATYLAYSPIHGLGAFSRGPIAQGTRVRAYDPLCHLTSTGAVFQARPASLRAEIGAHPHQPGPGGLSDCASTMGRYMNHAREVSVERSGVGWARRDIAAGEAPTCDYRHVMAETGHIDHLRRRTGTPSDARTA